MKYALVTGGSRGIGKAVSIKLAEMGYHVLINFLNNRQEAENTLAKVREAGSDGTLVQFNVTDSDQVEKVLGDWQQKNPDCYIEVLINNAGIRKDMLLMWMDISFTSAAISMMSTTE